MTQTICMAFTAVQCKVSRSNKFEWGTMYVCDSQLDAVSLEWGVVATNKI